MPLPRSRRRLAGLVRAGLCASLVLVVVGCSGGDDQRTIRTDDGEISIAEDGSEGVITGPDGEETHFSSGDSAELPGGWPDDVRLPDGAEVLLTQSMDGGEVMNVQAAVDGEVPDQYQHFRTELLDAGYDLLTDTLSDLGEETTATLEGDGDGRSVVVVLGSATEDPGRVSISMLVTIDEV